MHFLLMLGWMRPVWLGAAIVFFGLTAIYLISESAGPAFWFVAVPVSIAFMLAWWASLGQRWALLSLGVVALLVVILAAYFSVLVIGGPGPTSGMEIIAAAIPLVGGLVSHPARRGPGHADWLPLGGAFDGRG